MATKDVFKKLRLQNDLTQKELGEILNMSRKVISLYELGKRIPYPRTKARLLAQINAKFETKITEKEFIDEV